MSDSTVTGQTITDAQIGAVRAYEVAQGNDPYVNICDKALDGNPKCRSKVAFRYGELMQAGALGALTRSAV